MKSIRNEATEAQEQVVVKAVYVKPTIVSFDADSIRKHPFITEGGGGNDAIGPS